MGVTIRTGIAASVFHTRAEDRTRRGALANGAHRRAPHCRTSAGRSHRRPAKLHQATTITSPSGSASACHFQGPFHGDAGCFSRSPNPCAAAVCASFSLRGVFQCGALYCGRRAAYVLPGIDAAEGSRAREPKADGHGRPFVEDAAAGADDFLGPHSTGFRHSRFRRWQQGVGRHVSARRPGPSAYSGPLSAASPCRRPGRRSRGVPRDRSR